MIRVLVDTNVWVSAFLSPRGHCRGLIESLRVIGAELISSRSLLCELADVLGRERLRAKYRFTSEEAQEYLALVQEAVAQAAAVTVETSCRDPRDQLVLETAVGGCADYVLTRDDDLKREPELMTDLAQRGIRIVSISQLRGILKLSPT